MNMTRRAALAFPAVLAAQGAAAAATWRIVTEYPANAMPGEGIAAFAEAATTAADGALQVAAAFDGQGGLRSATMLRAVHDGTIEAADAFTGALSGEALVFQLSALPFLTETPADTARLLAAARPAYTRVLRERGAVLLYATPWPPTGLWSRTAMTREALPGLRVRTYDAASTAVMRNARAAPEQISFADALPRVRSGEMDAVMSSGDGGAGARLWELLPHFTVLDYASPLSLAFCSVSALDALPAAARAAVLRAGEATEARQFRSILGRSAANEARMAANGVRSAAVPELRAALAEAGRPVVEGWTRAAGPEGEAILAAYHPK